MCGVCVFVAVVPQAEVINGFSQGFQKFSVQVRPSWVFPWIAVGPAIQNIFYFGPSANSILYPEPELQMSSGCTAALSYKCVVS